MLPSHPILHSTYRLSRLHHSPLMAWNLTSLDSTLWFWDPALKCPLQYNKDNSKDPEVYQDRHQCNLHDMPFRIRHSK